jgi:hypothetical protein
MTLKHVKILWQHNRIWRLSRYDSCFVFEGSTVQSQTRMQAILTEDFSWFISVPRRLISEWNLKLIYNFFLLHSTIKPVLNGPFIKWNFVLNGNIFRSRDYHSIPWLNGNLASAEKCSVPLRFRLRQFFFCIFSSIFLFLKNKRRLIRSLCCLSVYPSVWVHLTVYSLT